MIQLNIGQLLTTHFEKHRTRRAALARHMNTYISTILRYQKSESLQTKILFELCIHLKHNFFMDIAQMLPPEYTTTQNPFEAKDQRIAQLEEELKLAKTERDVLLKVMGK
jgi:hypothetical protein